MTSTEPPAAEAAEYGLNSTVMGKYEQEFHYRPFVWRPADARGRCRIHERREGDGGRDRAFIPLVEKIVNQNGERDRQSTDEVLFLPARHGKPIDRRRKPAKAAPPKRRCRDGGAAAALHPLTTTLSSRARSRRTIMSRFTMTATRRDARHEGHLHESLDVCGSRRATSRLAGPAAVIKGHSPA